MRMTAREIYASLSGCNGWREQSRKVRWCASRYYAGVDSADELYRLCQRMPVSGEGTLPGLLTVADVKEIIRLR